MRENGFLAIIRRYGPASAMAAALLVADTADAQPAGAEPQTAQEAEQRRADVRQQAHPTEPDWFLEPTYAAPMFGSTSQGAQGRPVVEIQSFHHVPMFPRQNSGRYQFWISAEDGGRARESASRSPSAR